jgi:hypothetical protein
MELFPREEGRYEGAPERHATLPSALIGKGSEKFLPPAA